MLLLSIPYLFNYLIWLILGDILEDTQRPLIMALKGRALVILAEGAEEMEAIIVADVLRRGKV